MTFRRQRRERSIDLAGPLTLLQAADVATWYEELAPTLARMLGSRGSTSARIAEDVVQDVFVRIIEIAPRLAAMERKQRRSFVVSMAYHLHHDRVRRVQHSHGVEDALHFGAMDDYALDRVTLADAAHASEEWLARAQPDAQPEQTTAARLSLRAVWDATPREYRELLLLVAQGTPRTEMAARLGMSEAAVSMRLVRMRRMLLDVGKEIAR